MSRTLRYKLLYAAALVLATVLLVGLIRWTNQPLVTVFFLLILLVPGRLQGHYWREFFRGRKLLETGHPEESISCFERFIAKLEERPRLRRVIWLGGAIYTRDVEAMALNNIGAARMRLGLWEQAEKSFQEALQRDPEYPIPYFGLAVLAQVRGDSEKAKAFLEEAHARGFKNTPFDQLIAASEALYAKIEGTEGQSMKNEK